jgi:hypothetical protein
MGLVCFSISLRRIVMLLVRIMLALLTMIIVSLAGTYADVPVSVRLAASFVSGIAVFLVLTASGRREPKDKIRHFLTLMLLTLVFVFVALGMLATLGAEGLPAWAYFVAAASTGTGAWLSWRNEFSVPKV